MPNVTYRTAKQHGLNDGDEFTFHGRNGTLEDGVHAVLRWSPDTRGWEIVAHGTGRSMATFGVAGKFHASRRFTRVEGTVDHDGRRTYAVQDTDGLMYVYPAGSARIAVRDLPDGDATALTFRAGGELMPGESITADDVHALGDVCDDPGHRHHGQRGCSECARIAAEDERDRTGRDAAADAEDDAREQLLMTELVDTVDKLNRAGVPRSVAIERVGRLVGICAATDDRSRTVVANAAIKAFGNVGQMFGPHLYVPGDVVLWARGYRPGARLAGIDMPELDDPQD